MHYQSKRSNIRLPKLIVVISLILTILFLFGLSRELMNRHEINKQVKNLDKQIKELVGENQQLSQMIGSLQGTDFIEKEARLKLGLQKPGEKVAIIKRDNTAASTLVLSEGTEISGNVVVGNKDNISKPKKWWIYFFK